MFREKRAIALGFFDGIHIGHAALLKRLDEVSEKKGLKSTVLSFDTLPQNLFGDKKIPLINSPEDKVRLILRYFRVNDIFFLNFDKKMAAMAWEDFFDLLIKEYNAHHIVIGNNFKLGKGAQGNSEMLKNKCSEHSVGCDVISDVSYDSVVSSSTYIRELLIEGNIERANEFLGHPHVLTETVQNGNRLGSKLGTPTLNMQIPEGVLVPKHGVYATKVYSDNYSQLILPGKNSESNASYVTNSRLAKRDFSKPMEIKGLPAITNIGIRPTVGDSKNITVETHIPGFNKNIYGCKVRVEFHKHLRPEIKFENIEELKKQIKKDCDAAVGYFNYQEKDYN